jgi:hypothetical protein
MERKNKFYPSHCEQSEAIAGFHLVAGVATGEYTFAMTESFFFLLDS